MDGLTATTYGPPIDHFKEYAPKTKVVTDKRFVDNRNIEYNWDKSYRYVRAKLADSWLAPLYDFGPPLNGETLKCEGNEKYWVAEYEVVRKESLKEFGSQIPEMARMHHWRNLKTNETGTSYSSEWTRKDFDKRDWVCSVAIRKKEGFENRFLLSYVIRLR